MSTRKLLHEEVNRVNKLLVKQKIVSKNEDELIVLDNDFVVDNTFEAKTLPSKRKLLTKQYYKLRATLADYIDNAQISLFDQAIRIMDKVHINKENNSFDD